MPAYDDLVPFTPPTTHEVEIDKRNRSIEEARRLSEEQLAMVAAKVLITLIEAMDEDDPQVRLSAARELFSRILPKVAAVHADPNGGPVESADTVALRDSILEEIQKKHSK